MNPKIKILIGILVICLIVLFLSIYFTEKVLEEGTETEENVTVIGELHYLGHPFSFWVISSPEERESYAIGGGKSKEIIEYGEGSKFEVVGTIRKEKRCIPEAGEFHCYKEDVLCIHSYKVLYSFENEKKKLQAKIDKLQSRDYLDYVNFCQDNKPNQISEHYSNKFVIDCLSYSANKLASIGLVDSIRVCKEIEISFGVNYGREFYDCLLGLNSSNIEICKELQKVEIPSMWTHIKKEIIDTCYRHVAFNLNNPKLCEKITGAYHHGYCYIDLAKLNGDSRICDDIKYDGGVPSYKDTCYKETANDIETCDKIGQNYSEEWIIEEMKDMSSSAYLLAKRYKYECYLSVAIRNNDKSVCDKIPDEEIKKECCQSFH